MLPSSVESEKLFAKPIPVTIKDGFTLQSRPSHLSLTVEWQEAPASIHRQELLITLTDGNDPFFLYNLHLSEEDFQTLKNSQGLLVDFSAFPQKFIDLINLCLAEENKAQPKFLLVLNVGEKIGNIASTAQLDVVETNPFKHLTHLSLKFLAATDSAVKQYLGAYFRNLKEEKRSLQNKLCFTENDFSQKLTRCQGMLEKKSQELESMRTELSTELNLKESAHARELSEEIDKLMCKKREDEDRLEKEKKKKEAELKKTIQQLQSRVTSLETLNREIQDKNSRQDSTIRDLRGKVSSLEGENNAVKESLRNCKDQNESFQGDIKDKRAHLCQQKDKIEQLEAEVVYKKQQNEKIQDQLEEYHKRIKNREEELQEMQDKLRKKDRYCSSLEEDITKANELIQKLQREIKIGHDKSKTWVKLSSKQEYYLKEKERIIQKLTQDLTNVNIDCRKKTSEIKILTDASTSYQEKITNLEKEIKMKKTLIQCLNRRIYDGTAVPQLNHSPTLLTKYPAIDGLGIGDPGTFSLNQPVTTKAGGPKSVPTRDKNYSPRKNGTDLQEKRQTTVDSAYSTSPSCNTKSANIITGDKNANQTDLEIDSQALSAAFGGDHVLRHSTAKKQTYLKGTRNFKKS